MQHTLPVQGAPCSTHGLQWLIATRAAAVKSSLGEISGFTMHEDYGCIQVAEPAVVFAGLGCCCESLLLL
jgi:hypothetical protein